MAEPLIKNYTDGTDGQAATPLPVMAQQDLATATAQTVQPPAPTLSSANPVAPVAPGVMPVAAPAAAAAAAAPVTPAGPAVIPTNPVNQIPTGDAAHPNLTSVSPNAPIVYDKGAYPNVAGIPVGSQQLAQAGNTTLSKVGDWLGYNGASFMGGAAGALGELNAARNASIAARSTRAAVNQEIRTGLSNVANPTYDATQSGRAVATVPQAGQPGSAVATIPPAGQPGSAVATIPKPAVPGAPTPVGGPKMANTNAKVVPEGQSADYVRSLANAAPAEVEAANAAKAAEATSGMSTAKKAAIAAAGATGLGGVTATGMYMAGAPSEVPAAPGSPTPATVTPTAPGALGYAQPEVSAIPGPGGPAVNLNDVKREGNSYSGAPNIAGPITINGQQPGGQGVGATTAPTAEQAAQAHYDNLSSLYGQTAHLRDMNAATVERDRGWSGVIDTERQGMSKDEREKFYEEADLRSAKNQGSWSPRGGHQGNALAVKAAMEPIERRAKKEAETLRAGNDLAKTKLTTQAENARSAASNAITLRGQDTTAATAREGHRTTAETARANTLATIRGQDTRTASETAKLDYEKKKDDREYQRTLAKDGSEKAEKEWKSRNDAQDEVTKRAVSMRPASDKDGAAKDAQAVMTHVEDIKARLEAQVAADPTNKEAANQLDLFKRFGARNLDDKQINDLIKGNQLAEKVNQQIARQGDGILRRMWQGTNQGVVSNEPFRGVKKVVRGGVLPDIYVETDEQGRPLGVDRKPLAAGSDKYGRVLPASVVEQDEGIWGTGILARRNDNFRSITHH